MLSIISSSTYFSLPMFKLFVELGLDLNNKEQNVKNIGGDFSEGSKLAKFIIDNVELNLNLQVPQGSALSSPYYNAVLKNQTKKSSIY